MRNTSCECLLQILIVSGPQALEKIMQTNYLDALIQLMLTSIQENDEIVKKIMMYIKQFFSELHDVYSGGLLSFPYRRILPNNDLTIPFTELIKMSEEQIEESGGIEEIEARIIYMGPMMYYTSFDMQKVNTKEAIQNNYAVIMRNRRMRRRRQRI
ncbi:MAG: hypothetical protein EZS28_008083 [Streblomastix strix]|uniref:Uncharacterized protein n=1 Tax=Streblomastix strix TaxID=222440 RepID=A0A5J4WMU5_9EUKA|nr:MAG: hypothetical protein EZS28_008083 [Streblomastix strix]